MKSLEELAWPDEYDLTSLWLPAPEGRFPRPLFRATVRQAEAPMLNGVVVAKTDAAGEGLTAQDAVNAAVMACSNRWLDRQTQITYNRTRPVPKIELDLSDI